MPSWSIHLSVAGKVYEKLEKKYLWLEKNEFLFGNILPDLFEGHIVPGLSCVVRDYSTHFPKQQVIKGVSVPIPNLDRFLEQYQGKLNNSVILGYFCHLFIDRFWNQFSFENIFLENQTDDSFVQVRLQNGEIKETSFQEANEMKQNDFRIFSEQLRKTEKLNYPCFSHKILEEVKQIKKFHYTKEDIEKTIVFIHTKLKDFDKVCSTEYLLFSKEKMYQMHQKSIQDLLEEIIQIIERAKNK